MIKKIIACADIHFRNLEGLQELQTVLIKFLDQCKDIIAKEESPDDVRVVVAGDLVESKISISNECTLALGWFLRQLNELGCKVYIIGGNHDTVLSNLQRVDSITPLFQIGEYKNVIYLDSELEYQSGCYVDDNVVWCLYSMFSDFDKPEISEYKIKYPDKKFVGIIHCDINGAVNYKGFVTSTGLDPQVFTGLDFVIAGHIHKFQEIKKNKVKVVYCSSIKQKDFSETLSQHGFVLWNLEDDSYQFIEVPNEDGGFYKFLVTDIKDIEKNKEVLLNP